VKIKEMQVKERGGKESNQIRKREGVGRCDGWGWRKGGGYGILAFEPHHMLCSQIQRAVQYITELIRSHMRSSFEITLLSTY